MSTSDTTIENRALTPISAALADFQRGRGDPIALARKAARAAAPGSPELVEARIVEASLLLCSRDVRDFEVAGWVYAQIALFRKNPLQEMHASAIRVAVDGDYALACRIYDRILEAYPVDALALGVAQVFDHYLGNPATMRARSGRALAEWPTEAPDYHAVLAQHAFALQECGEYAQAEALARRALELDPLNLRAHHAVAHVMEMQGRFEEGVRWMGSRSQWWTGAGAASVHLWWHLALYHLELGRPEHALAILDHRLKGDDSLSELVDASALLWRLYLRGIGSERRFAALAASWAPHAEDAHCAFNDLHAMMAFVAARRWDCTARLLAAQERRAERPGANRDMTRLVGLPASRALAAFGRGDYDLADALLRSLPPVAHRIGGSHAQRDVLQLTRAAAAARKFSAPRALRLVA
jgi:tetratricopeptide (TPR) repeat protein